MQTENETEVLNFDQMFLGFEEDAPGGAHLATVKDIALARKEEEDSALLLSNEAELFCKLIVMHGMLPSEAYLQAFSKRGDDNELIRPDLPAYHSRVLLRQIEVKARIEEIRNEILLWGKTSLEEVENNYRRIALNIEAKDSDRINATKALCALRGFDAQPEMMSGATITINLPFTPQQLGQHRVIEHESE